MILQLNKAHLPALIERLESSIECMIDNRDNLQDSNFTSEDTKLLFEVDHVFDLLQVNAMKAEIVRLSNL